MEDERHVILACGRFERERQELLQEVGMDRCADQDLVFTLLMGRAMGSEGKEAMAKRFKEVKRFARRVLHRRCGPD